MFCLVKNDKQLLVFILIFNVEDKNPIENVFCGCLTFLLFEKGLNAMMVLKTSSLCTKSWQVILAKITKWSENRWFLTRVLLKWVN
jgi:hypothetical protein